ncbi:hypothetical protein IX317_002252 [Fusobacterium sp. DD29]|uniref:Crp/Fnr family transcriptional regulator n=1 Tax=unclassified Fusobacterium TaxID=2648384 RepID=UPI001B8C347A|nr:MULTISPECIES: Crp/Fnr family transcriptional regulator [unclassified Fusobacterium]MBR8702330.1 hypothetical protein [Fusobacterium sp. DD45]MBR8712147.1 hypothetical protein [Fusobacterium sp. DD28]MBR8750529.1 hypothetical protein [Fusobacterium sp. DD29]MBR8752726.1 hypothetical protein [Fusobacterium sp. DD26]MBR8762772.1 hypothetical protein [Fusobacterium sp. DD25]
MKGIDLNKIVLFEGLDLDRIQRELSEIKVKILKYKKGENIALRGDRIKGLYINISGTLVSEMLKENGESKKIEELKSGMILASAFIFGKFNFFPVDLIAKTDVEILYLEKKEFISLLKKDEKIMERFLDEVSEKAQFLSHNLWESISNKKIEQKLAEYILSHEKDGILEMEITIKELSEFFNVSRPSLSRVLKEFTDTGIIERMKRGSYKVLDRDYLESL